MRSTADIQFFRPSKLRATGVTMFGPDMQYQLVTDGIATAVTNVVG